MSFRVHQLNSESLPDGDYILTIDGGVVEYTPMPGFAFNPLVTVVGGVPGLVFDDDGQIVYLED